MKKMICLILALLVLLTVPGLQVRAAEDAAYWDVSIDQWYFQSVCFCSEMGLMNGIGRGQFAPAGTLNRAMFVTILHRLAGAPAAAPGGFTDVPADSFYAEAVGWAAEQGIVNGTGDGTFSPGQSILRQDMACMVARYLLAIDAQLLRGDECEQVFLDMELVSEYARESVELMRSTGLFRGDAASNFRPLETANRAEAATLFTRLALALKLIPEQAVLETEGESCTLSVEDTIWLYIHLSALPWQDGLYAEYVPTHTMTLWNGEYRFDFSQGHAGDHINYVCGAHCMGCAPDPTLMGLIYERICACRP